MILSTFMFEIYVPSTAFLNVKLNANTSTELCLCVVSNGAYHFVNNQLNQSTIQQLKNVKKK